MWIEDITFLSSTESETSCLIKLIIRYEICKKYLIKKKKIYFHFWVVFSLYFIENIIIKPLQFYYFLIMDFIIYFTIYICK